MKLDRYRYQPEPEHSGWLMQYRHPDGYALGTLPVLRFERNSPVITIGLPLTFRTSRLGVKAELDGGSSHWFVFEPDVRPGERCCAGCREDVDDELDHRLCSTPVERHPTVSFSLLPRTWVRVCPD